MNNFNIVTDDVMISHLFPYFTTEEIVHVLGLISRRFQSLSKQNHIWKILITRVFTLKYDMDHEDATTECYKRKLEIYHNDIFNLPVSASKICWIALRDEFNLGMDLKNVPREVIDFDMCYFSVKQNNLNIRHVPEDMEKYEEIALCCVRNEPKSLNLIPIDKRTSKVCRYCVNRMNVKRELQFSSTSMNVYGDCPFRYVPTSLEDYEDLAKLAMKKCGHLIKFVPHDTKNYESIASEAVMETGDALQFIPMELRTFDLCLLAVHSGSKPHHPLIFRPCILQHVPMEFRSGFSGPKGKSYRELCTLALRNNGNELQHMNKEQEFCCVAVLSSSEAIEYVPQHMRNVVMKNLHKYVARKK